MRRCAASSASGWNIEALVRSNPSVAAQPDIRVTVDRLLAAEKTLAGTASFQPLQGEQRQQRWRKACVIQGEVTPLDIEVQAYPDSPNLKFRIILIYQRAIWRLDYSEDGTHFNSTNRPNDLGAGPICGPHYHTWEDNRRFSTKSALPHTLRNARNVPSNLRTFENAFRWFCGETRILVLTAEIPCLPTRVSLL